MRIGFSRTDARNLKFKLSPLACKDRRCQLLRIRLCLVYICNNDYYRVIVVFGIDFIVLVEKRTVQICTIFRSQACSFPSVP